MNFWIRLMLVLVLGSLLFIAAMSIIVEINTREYCKSLGYEDYEIVGRGNYFNCCNYPVRNVLYSNYTVYEENKKCIAGGTFPAK